jgi:hypothetical protein
MMKSLHFFVAICVVCPFVAGCGGGSGQPYVTAERLDKGLVIVLPGICGRLWVTESIAGGLAQGGVEQAVEIYDWTYQGRFFPLYNLSAIQRNHRVASDIVEHVREYRREHPGRPVTLVGYSGGGPLAIWAAEAMPEGGLDGVVLLSTPLVPQYDLTEVLERSAKGIVSFHSNRDVLFLAVGTMVFGTMDQQHTVSAGNVGFVAPDAGAASLTLEKPTVAICSPEEQAQAAAGARAGGGVVCVPAPYERLYQICWRPEMEELGYDGSHLTIGSRAFVAQYVAPLVRARAWDEAFVAGVSRGQCRIPSTCPAGSPKI